MSYLKKLRVKICLGHKVLVRVDCEPFPWLCCCWWICCQSVSSSYSGMTETLTCDRHTHDLGRIAYVIANIIRGYSTSYSLHEVDGRLARMVDAWGIQVERFEKLCLQVRGGCEQQHCASLAKRASRLISLTSEVYLDDLRRSSKVDGGSFDACEGE